MATDVSELTMRGTSPAPRFSAFAAALPRPANPTWPRNPPPIEAKELDEFLSARGSPMAGMGEALLDVGWRYNLDPRLLVAIAGADTGFGRVLCTDFNAWNWFWFEWCNSPFESWRQALDEVARGLRVHYLDQGLTSVQSIANRYGPLDDPKDTLGLNRHWPGNVSRYMEMLGGSHCSLTWVHVEGPCAPLRAPPARPAPQEEAAVATAEAEPADEPAENTAPLPSLSELARAEESFSFPVRVQREAALTIPTAEPREEIAMAWTPLDELASDQLMSTGVPEPVTSRYVAAASVSSPPAWTFVAVLLVGGLIAGARTLGTCRPAILDPGELILRRRAMRDDVAPDKLASQ